MSGSGAARGKPVVTVVNDDATQLRLYSGLLSRDGLEVRAYPSAEAALAEWGTRPPPDLVLTDLHMPGLDGWRLCRLLRSSCFTPHNRVPILVVSATSSSVFARQLCVDLGADGFLAAPCDPVELRATVRALLAGQPSPGSPWVLLAGAPPDRPEILAAFAGRGYRVEAVATSAAARDLLTLGGVHVVVVAADLPDESGETLVQSLRPVHPETVFLLMAGSIDPDRAVRFLRAGAVAFAEWSAAPRSLVDLCDRVYREHILFLVEEMMSTRIHPRLLHLRPGPPV